ncbi:MAG: hypothetical protein WC373_11625 [Smithella sp.]
MNILKSFCVFTIIVGFLFALVMFTLKVIFPAPSPEQVKTVVTNQQRNLIIYTDKNGNGYYYDNQGKYHLYQKGER